MEWYFSCVNIFLLNRMQLVIFLCIHKYTGNDVLFSYLKKRGSMSFLV